VAPSAILNGATLLIPGIPAAPVSASAPAIRHLDEDAAPKRTAAYRDPLRYDNDQGSQAMHWKRRGFDCGW